MIKVCVIGLGYVGLPICLKISKYFNTVGFDINKDRIQLLNRGLDINNEYKKKDFIKKKIFFSSKEKDLSKCNFFIICVPTPITKSKKPDLFPVEQSFKTVSKVLKKKDVIVLESTVFPGVTRTCIKKIEINTKLKNNKDFFTCYSPERINPGDKKFELSKINKILAYEGKDQNIKEKLKVVYSKICKKIIFTNKIEEAETAKGIENIQRDLNIALFNEILLICRKLNINFNEVIRLASTKWNFIRFSPGLVGGHCLPVDPYYLTYIANKNNYKSKVTLAGRAINENMKNYVIDFILNKIKQKNPNNKNIKFCLIGLTYKYGVSDTRNSLNLQILKILKTRYKNVSGYDPFINDKEFRNFNSLNDNDFYIFLSKGKKFMEIYKKINNKKKVIDPFSYYSNF